jgi:hypothetical protein
VETSVRAVDEAVLGRLRHAIDAEAGGEEEQLNGALRMLGAESPDKNQISLFGRGTGRQRAKALRPVLAKRSEGALSLPMASLMAKIRKWLGLGRRS